MSLSSYALPTAPLAVAFDQDCGLCRASRAWAERLLPPSHQVSLEWAQAPRDARLRAVPIEARLTALTAAEGEQLLRGFAAVSALVRRAVLGPVLAPAVWVLERSGAGEALYRAAAQRRRRACARPPQR